MNPIVKYFANLALKTLLLLLIRLTDEQLRKVASGINKKIDIPNLSEDVEAGVIYDTLKLAVTISKELLNSVKV